MKTLVITANLENEIKDIRALEAKINELDELKKEKEALREKYQIAEELLNMADTYKEKKEILDKYTKNVL